MFLIFEAEDDGEEPDLSITLVKSGRLARRTHSAMHIAIAQRYHGSDAFWGDDPLNGLFDSFSISLDLVLSILKAFAGSAATYDSRYQWRQ